MSLFINFQVPYTITIIDTPGFGDTEGISRDRKFDENIRKFFETHDEQGIDHLDAICFIAQAGIARDLYLQKYVTEKLLALFGENMKKNIVFWFTFLDGGKPKALSAFKEDEIFGKNIEYFGINNGSLFVGNSNNEEDLNKHYWENGKKSFEKFFQILDKKQPQTLALTKDVLMEKAGLEMKFKELQDKIDHEIEIIHQLLTEDKSIQQHAADIEENCELETNGKVKIPHKFKTYFCKDCNKIFYISKPGQKPSITENSSKCSEGTGQCKTSTHKKLDYLEGEVVIDFGEEVMEKMYRYITAKQKKTNSEAKRLTLHNYHDEHRKLVSSLVAAMQSSIKKLSKIALRNNTRRYEDYLHEFNKLKNKQLNKDLLKELENLQRQGESKQ